MLVFLVCEMVVCVVLLCGRVGRSSADQVGRVINTSRDVPHVTRD